MHTLANLSDVHAHKIATLRRLLRNEALISADELFETSGTQPHGHVEAVLGAIRKLGVETMIAAKRSRERDIVIAISGQ